MELPVVSRGEHSKLVRFFATLPAVLGAISAIIGVLSLAAWIAGREEITSLIPESMPMAPVSAVCIVIAGIALIVARKTSQLFAWALRILAGIIALLSLSVLVASAAELTTP